MEERPKHPHSGRDATDQSLGLERDKTDEELAKRRTDIDESADEVIAGARSRADRLLESARTKADAKLPNVAGSPAHAAVANERTREDEVLRRERTTADDQLAGEREARRRALASLLAQEREQTDDHLLLERHRADAAIGSRDDFLAMVSHDLRNMLGGMAMSAISLTTIPCEDEKVTRAIARNAQRIQQYTARMDRLVGDLLDVVSIEAGRLSLEPERHDPRELLSETSEVFRAIAAAKGISIEVGTSEAGLSEASTSGGGTASQAGAARGALSGHYDRERLLQVLANLVGNAIKFTPRGGHIGVRLEPSEAELRFAVSDDGAGIASDKLELIFERFWQAEGQQTGVGLGLYISKCIVESHGGKMWVDSRLGGGSTFYFTVPGPPAPEQPQLDGS